MKYPEFPKAFFKHCPKVGDAKFHGVIPKDDLGEEFAECAFVPRGIGMMCENCTKFMTRPYLDHEVDREFLPQIEDFYRKLDAYYKEHPYEPWNSPTSAPVEKPAPADNEALKEDNEALKRENAVLKRKNAQLMKKLDSL